MRGMEIKKRHSSVRTVVLLLGLFILSACTSDDLSTSGKKGGSGFVSLSLNTDTAYSVTKASPNPENVNDYTVNILQGSEVVTSFLFGDKPEKLALDAGDYTARATFGTLVPASFESLYMEGTTNFSIKNGETAQVKLDCSPANAKVTVDYADDLKKAYSNYTVSMSTSHTGKSPLVYTKDETRPGYFQVDKEGEKLNLQMLFATSSKEYTFTNSVDFLPRDLVRLHFKLGNNGSTQDSIKKPDPTLAVNVAGFLFEANKNLTQSVAVTSNCDWTIVNTANWLKVEKQSGNAVFTIAENTTEVARKSTVMLIASNGNKSVSTNIEVFQQGKSSGNNTPDLAVDIIDLKLSGDAFQQAITVRSTKEWKYTNNAEDWLTVTRSQEDTTILTLSAGANATAEVRKAMVAITAGEGDKTTTVTIQVEQKAKEDDPYINVDFTNLRLPSTGVNSQAYTVETNQKDWSVSTSADWLKAEKGEGKMLLTVDPNDQNTVRSADITLMATQGIRNIMVKITVTQEAKPLDVPPLQIVVTINRVLEEKPITYTIENLFSTEKKFNLSFSTGNNILEGIRKGTAPENFYLNIVGLNGAKIQKCEWAEGLSFNNAIDLANVKRSETSALGGLIWDDNLKGQSLATIYLENFVKTLAPGLHKYKVKVTGTGENNVSYSSETQLEIQITE